MQTEQKEFVERRFKMRAWHGRSRHAGRVLKDFSFEKLELAGWTLHRQRESEPLKLKAIRSLWRHGESTEELLAIDVFECPSVKAAHDQLLEALGNMQSDAIELRTGKGNPGDVAFGLGDTMILFAIANLVVLVRNAGPVPVGVGKVARELERTILKSLERTRSREK